MRKEEKRIEQRCFLPIYSHNDRHLLKYDNNKITEYIVGVKYTEKGGCWLYKPISFAPEPLD